MRFRINVKALEGLSEAERAQALRELRELEHHRKTNPLAYYTPHAKQREFHGSKATFRAFLGGNRAGKTTAGIGDDLIQAVDRDVLPEHLLPYKRWEPPFFCRVVIPDLGPTLEGVTLQKVREWCPPSQLQGGSLDSAWDAKLRILRFRNGSWFQFNSNEQELSKLAGTALHRVHFDEEPRRDIYQESLMRLIDFNGDVLLTMTPLLGLSWTFDELYEPYMRGELPDSLIVEVDMDDNPHLTEAAKERALAGLSHEEREARKKGRFVHFAGLIYDEFDQGVHVAPPLTELPEIRTDIAGIDPGIRFPALLFAFVDEHDVLHVFDELCPNDVTVDQLAIEYHRRSEQWGFCPGPWNVIDPSARNRDQRTGKSLQEAFRRAGVVTILGQNDVMAGINAVKQRLQTGRLVVHANCETTIQQLRKYRWRTPSRQAEAAVPERPVKRDDHTCDALRYIVMSPLVTPRRPRVQERLSMKEYLLREHLRKLERPVINHPAGPGVFV